MVEKIDNIDAQINTCLDGLLEKGFEFFLKIKMKMKPNYLIKYKYRFKEREDALKILKKLFSNKYVIEHLNSK